MKDLLIYIIQTITGADNFRVEESYLEQNVVNYEITADPSIIGLIIGKEGRTIKNIRRLLSIRATKEKVAVNINVVPSVAQ